MGEAGGRPGGQRAARAPYAASPPPTSGTQEAGERGPREKLSPGELMASTSLHTVMCEGITWRSSVSVHSSSVLPG